MMTLINVSINSLVSYPGEMVTRVSNNMNGLYFYHIVE
jgi:hypothetical protein